MTVLDAIRESIAQLEMIRLSVRDEANGNRVRTALALLDAVEAEITRAQDKKAEVTENDCDQ